ncbi:reverse transcriptase [Gossypium australe]|uniref:Reverse transcriptase n=1 Tax=Gossypium australe TaxID=47621 RepID=A0A5B6UY32_9ROSI|nr:reverse transcriptase [Gossypium australe]
MESLRAQLKSIWKTKKKFEFHVVGQNLFSIIFDLEDDLEFIMEGRPWLFRKYLILFERLRDPIEREQIKLTSSPYWIHIGPCPPEYDRKDLLHVIGSTFGVERKSGMLKEVIPNGDKSLLESKPRWKRLVRSNQIDYSTMGNAGFKRKYPEERNEEGATEVVKAGNSRAMRRLLNLITQYNPRMVFFMETKLDQKRMERVRNKGGFTNGIDVATEGTRGGLCLAWKDSIEVTLKSYSKWHIDVMVKEDRRKEEWRFTGLYGSPYVKDQDLVWTLLKSLSRDCSCPWLVAGDFNEIMYSFEKKKGELQRDQHRMEMFRDTLAKCHLMDVGYSGAWFTWEMGNLPETNIRERLDRGLQMRNGFLSSNNNKFLGGQRFHFEAWWTMKASFEGVLKDIWESSTSTLVDKLKTVQIRLKNWAKELKGNKGKLKERLTKELEALMMAGRDDETLAEIIDKKIHLNLEIDKEEKYWEQRARTNWLQFGHRNTSYFHKCASIRRRANCINNLVLDNGREITNDSSLKEEATRYFETLFTSKEVANPGKVLEGEGIELTNTTDIVLIPKVQKPKTLVEFRPISLCSVLYKVIAKTIANRLQDVMGQCIDKAQSAFVPGRLITDNVLLAYELLHTFRLKRTGKKGLMAVKLDMSKTYDKWSGISLRSEGLSTLMRIAKNNGLVNGARASRGGPVISHLLFADDCMLFEETTEKGVRILKEIIQEYKRCSGQCATVSRREGDFPKVLCEMIESKLARYWWQKGAGRRGIHWCQWKWLCRSKDEGGLGFKNMAQFSVSFLAKQVWRLLNFPDSLVAQVFKAKYFPASSFLNSRLGHSCSYVWRSIWAAKGVLEKGLIWRVGTGAKISITEDAWIPNYVNFSLRPNIENMHLDKVADLIDNNKREWNRELIENTFPEDVADLILRIPLSCESHNDFLAWRGEASGNSVRNSYKLLQSLDPTAYALQNFYKDFYRKLWQIEVPTKIKIFIWKISWNFLTNRVNMVCRRLASCSICPRCGGGYETMNHLFRECPVSLEMWRALSTLDLSTGISNDFGEWLTMVLTSLNLEKGRIFCVALWAVWGDRNSRIHEKISKSGQQIARFILSYLKELNGVREVTQKNAIIDTKWRHPPAQTIKVNFDGAFDERSKVSASGVVVRNSSGRILISSTKVHRGILSGFAAEAVACRHATQVALGINAEEIIIEGDALSVIKKCKNTTQISNRLIYTRYSQDET